MNRSNNTSKDGGILPLVLFVLLLISILGIGMFRLAETDTLETGYAQNRGRAFWLAEAGLSEFKAIVSEPINFTPLENIGLVGTGIVSGSIPEFGSYSIDVIADAQNGSGAIQRYTVISTGTSLGGETSRVEAVATTTTFGLFSYASHNEQGILFGNNDVLGRNISDLDENGVFQSDDTFTISGSPDFYSAIRSSQNGVEYTDSRSSQYVDPNVFHNGLELGVDELDFTEQNFDQIEEVVPPSKRLTGNYELTFLDENYVLKNKETGILSTNSIASLGSTATERIIYIDGDVEVEGEVGTAVSVAAKGSIYITDDLVYSSSLPYGHHTDWPSNYTPDEDEVLGLFSETRVQIAEGWNIGDVDIHATILVTEYEGSSSDTTYSGFGADWDGGGDHIYTKAYGVIYLYGSLSQYRRAAVGRLDGNIYGYNKQYVYDSRLLSNPAPGTPTTGYALSNWRQL